MNRLSLVTLFWLAACGSSPPIQPDAGCPSGVLVAVSDYTSSGVGVLPLDGSPAQILFGSDLGADPALATSAGRNFFIERDGAQNIYELDACGHAIATFASHGSSETTVDPQDVAAASDGSLWVARFAVASAFVTSPSANATIDMSSLDADGNPNMSSVRIVSTSSGEKAFFALERLDNNDPNLSSKQPSQMAVVDTKSRSIEQVVTLAGRNPFGPMFETQGKFWLADMGNADQSGEADAGVEVFTPETRTSSLLIPESVLGLSVGAVAVDGTCGAAIAFDAVPNVNHTALVSFDTAGDLVQNPAFGPTDGFDLAGLVWKGGRLLVGDRRSDGGRYAVHTFTKDAQCKLSQGPDLWLPMPPVALLPNGP